MSSTKNLTVTLTSLTDKATVTNFSTIIDSIPSRENRTTAEQLGFIINSNVLAEERIKLLLTYISNGDVMKSDTLEFIIGEPTYTFLDTTNNINSFWTVTATPSTPAWGTSTSSFYSSPNSYTDSPLGQYVNNATVIFTSTNNILLTGQSPRLSFWTKFDIESNWDYGQVEITTNNGTTWIPLKGLYTETGVGSFQPNGQPVYDGIISNWVKEEISLSQFVGQQIKLRFKLRTDGSQVKDGWYIDDIGIYNYAIIPVELISFNAEIFENNILLNWSTASETNNLGFYVERNRESSFGEASFKKNNWEVVGFVEGKGTTNELNNYLYEDNNLSTGKYSYRLKQTDFDGSFEYSNIIEVEIGLPSEFALNQNYPNPFNPTTVVSYQLPIESKVILKVYDVLGKEVATLVNESQSAGKYNINFNSSEYGNLSSGIYYYKLTAGDFVSTKKMILIK